MKLQLEPTLTEIVRKPRRHRIPENLFLQILIYIAVFAAVQILEMLAMMPFLMDSVYAWSSQQIAEKGAVDNTAMLSYLKALMMEPRNVRIMLFATAAGTIFVLFYTGVIEERRARTLGFHKKHILPQYLLGLLAGFAAFSMVVGVDLLCGGLQFEHYVGAFGGNLFLLLIGFLLQGMSEEVLCRGFIMTSTLRHHNLWWAVGINSVLFGLMHCTNKGFTLFALVNLILYAVMISLYVLRTGSLWGACAFHGIWNFAQGNFYGLPVSGIDVGDTVFSMSLKGSDLVSGGAFGLEASIGTTIVMLLWIAGLLFLPAPFRRKPENAQTEAAA